jgi:hypothetical protein
MIWTISLSLDTSDATQANILSTIQTNAPNLGGYSQSKAGSTIWHVQFNLDDSSPTQAGYLTSIYNAITKFQNISINKTV